MEASRENLQKQYSETFIEFLEKMGEMLITYGTLEELAEKLYGQKPENIDLTKIMDLEEIKTKLNEADPETIKKIALAMFELMAISNKIQNLNNLPSEEKKEVGKALKEIAGLLKSI